MFYLTCNIVIWKIYIFSLDVKSPNPVYLSNYFHNDSQIFGVTLYAMLCSIVNRFI